MATKKEKDYIIINGIKIQENTVYEIIPKTPTDSAPQHLKKIGSEKYSAPYVNKDGKMKSLISNTTGFPLIDNMWDTGFYPDSAVFRRNGANPDKAEEQSKKYKKFIVDYMASKNLKRKADQLLEIDLGDDNTFFDELKVELWEGRQFNTALPMDRLLLYMAIVSGEVAQGNKLSQEELAEGLRPQGDGLFSFAQYAVTSRESVRSVSERRDYENSRARGVLFNLLENDKKTLTLIANYEGVNINAKSDDMVINSAFSLYFDSHENIKSFLDTYDKSKNNKAFKEELDIIGMIREKKALHAFQKEGRNYFLLGKNLGSTEKLIAKNIASDETLLAEFFKITSLKSA